MSRRWRIGQQTCDLVTGLDLQVCHSRFGSVASILPCSLAPGVPPAALLPVHAAYLAPNLVSVQLCGDNMQHPGRPSTRQCASAFTPCLDYSVRKPHSTARHTRLHARVIRCIQENHGVAFHGIFHHAGSRYAPERGLFRCVAGEDSAGPYPCR